MAIVTVLVNLGVFYRYALNAPLLATEELSTFLIVIIVFIGAAAVTRKERHIAVKLIPLFVHNRTVLLIVDLSVSFVGFLSCLIFTYLGYTFLVDGISGGQILSITRIPQYWVYVFVPVGIGLMTLHYGALFVRRLSEIAHKKY